MSIPKIASYAMPDVMPSSRSNWQLDAKRSALLIHDMQDYFLDFYDVQAEPVPSLLAHIQQLRAQCDALGIPVFYSAQPAQQSAEQRGLLQDWWGAGVTARPERAQIVAALSPAPEHRILCKWRYSAFIKTDLLAQLQALGRDQLMVCGVYAHIGCMLSCADAFMHDVQAFMIGDAVADFSAQEQQLALNYVSQRCGVVVNTAQALAQLQSCAQADQAAQADYVAESTAQTDYQLPRSLAALQAEVAQLLEIAIAELPVDENLVFCGLDSMRLMTLAERWQAAGSQLQFSQLAAQSSLAQWWQLLHFEQSQTQTMAEVA